MLRLEPRAQPSKLWRYASPLLALAITVVLGVILFVALGKDPVRGLGVFFWVPIKSVLAYRAPCGVIRTTWRTSCLVASSSTTSKSSPSRSYRQTAIPSGPRIKKPFSFSLLIYRRAPCGCASRRRFPRAFPANGLARVQSSPCWRAPLGSTVMIVLLVVRMYK
mgnify:CR=1 FL=1